MPPELKNVATAADALVDLVKERKEISIKEAAKLLNTNPSTIEAWSNFFEEDGVLAIKYKFTTPYLTIPEGAKLPETPKTDVKLFQEKVASVEISTALKESANLIKSARETQAQGQFGLLTSIYDQLLHRAHKLVDFINSKDLTPQQKSELLQLLKGIEQHIQAGESLVKSRRYDEAHLSYEALSQKVDALMSLISKHYEDVSRAGPQSLKELMDKTYTLLQEGKIEQARGNYALIKQAFQTDTQKEAHEQTETRQDILQLNRDISINTLKIYKKRMIENSKKINFLAKQVDFYIKRRNFPLATSGYREIKNLFDELPPGFKKEKLKLQGAILKVYEKLTKERESQLIWQYQLMEKEIKKRSEAVQTYLTQNNLEQAKNSYNELSSMFTNLPPGFMDEKYALQAATMPLYHQLAQRLKLNAQQRLLQTTTRINSAIADMDQKIDAKQYDQAHELYRQINLLFKDIPDGFIRQKVQLQDRIIDAYEKLLIRQFSTNREQYKHSIESIEQLINIAHEALKSGNTIKANAIYRRLKKAYIELPSIDLETKQKLRTRILAIYKHVLALKPIAPQEPVPDLPAPNPNLSLDPLMPPRQNLELITRAPSRQTPNRAPPLPAHVTLQPPQHRTSVHTPMEPRRQLPTPQPVNPTPAPHATTQPASFNANRATPFPTLQNTHMQQQINTLKEQSKAQVRALHQ